MTAMRKQRGAALLVALLLLLILTILAISSMSAASVEFIMAGNEQYHQNAFQAAETGIAQTMSVGVFDSNVAGWQPVNGAVTATDSYAARYEASLSGVGQSAAIWTGMTISDYLSYHFEIQSTGTSVRNATTTNIQGVAKIAKSPGSGNFTKDPNSTTTALQ